MPAGPFVCGGRAVTRDLAADGDVCGKPFRGRGRPGRAELVEQARAAGWSVAGPVPMCPACRRPDPAIARGLVRA